MKPVVWMVMLCVASAVVAARLFDAAFTRDVYLGMIGPLVAAAGTWIAVSRASREAPARVSGVLMRGFAIKMILFGVYVVAMVKLAAVHPIPFVVSFTGYFVSLYVAEAALLSRLFRRVAR